MPTKSIPKSVTLWSALAVILSTLLQQIGIELSQPTLELTLLSAVQLGGAILVIWRRLHDPKPLRGWRRQPQRQKS